MENQIDKNQTDNSLASTIQKAERPYSSVIPPGVQDYVPVTAMFENAFTEIADINALDPAIISGVNQYKTDIDRYGINAMANLGVARPSFATDTFDPVLQQNPAQNDFSKIQQILNAPVSQGPGNDIAAPQFVSMRGTEFDRYYNNPKFADLGFSPYSNTEEFYNANSTVWDDMSRMSSQWTSLAGSGFSSVYRSIGDLFDGDDYAYSPDVTTAMEFEDAMRIGNSSRDGGLAWTNNLLLNSAYTAGIIGSIAVEELILFGAAAVQGGLNPVSDAMLVGRSAINAGRAVNAVKQFFTVFRGLDAGRDIYRTLKNTEAAKDFWSAAKTGRNVLGTMFAPNTMYALKNFKTAQNATQNGINIAKAANTFGGFYRDIRSINLALAESKLEGGMVYNQLIRDGIRIHEAKSGKNVTPEDMKKIGNAASEGAFYTTMANAPIIYASNWFVLGNSLGGFNRSLGRVFNDSFTKGFRRIVKTKGTRDGAGKLVKDVFEDVGAGFSGLKKQVIAGGWKGLIGSGGAAMGRYFAANIAEGVQEVSQEAVSAATTGYFNEVMKDPMAGGIELRNTMISSGIGSQLSGEGASVFMSGFLMGGVIQGPQKLFFQGVPSIYKYGLNQAGINVGSKGQNEAWGEYKTNRDNFIKQTVDFHNVAWNNQIDDPSSLFDESKFNFLMQKQLSGGMKGAAYNGDIFGFKDSQDEAKFQQMYTIYSNGTEQYFRGQLTDMLKLSNEELYEAFSGSAGVTRAEIKSGKIRTRLEDMVKRVDLNAERYEAAKDKFPNPFDSSQYNKEDKEYVGEVLKEAAWNHSRYLYMFTQDGFEQALERSNSIYSKLENDPIFGKMAAKDLTVLLSKESIDQELALLKEEQKLFSDPDKKTDSKEIKDKKERIRLLTGIKEVLENPKYLTKSKGKRKGSFDRRSIKKLRPAFAAYVKYLAGTQDEFVNSENIDKALMDIVDHIALKERARVYDKAIEYMGNPARFQEILDRAIAVNEQIYANIKEDFKETLTKYTTITEANQLMNSFLEMNPPVFADPEETKMFLKTNDLNYLKTFYTADGKITQLTPDGSVDILNKKAYGQVKLSLDTYRGIQAEKNKPVEKEKTESQVVNEQRNDVEDLLKGSGINIVLEQTNNTPMLNALLEQAYKKYSATNAVMGDVVLPFEKWRQTPEGINLQTAFNSLKKIWAAGVASNNQATQAVEYASPLDPEVVRSERGFATWATQRETIESPAVKKVLDQLNLKLSDIFVTPKAEVTKGSTLNNKPVITSGSVAAIIESESLDENGDIQKRYKIVDLLGNDLTTKQREFLDKSNVIHAFGTFTTLGQAKQGWKLLEATAPDTSNFTFDGVDGLHQGMTVYKDDDAYIILSNPGEAAKGWLKVIPAALNSGNKKERQDNTTPLQVGQFKNVYKPKKLNFAKVSANASRLEVNESITPYKHVNTNEEGGEFGAGEARYNTILSVLTAEELSQIEFVVTVDKDGGNINPAPYIIKGSDGKTYAEPNDLIRIVTSKYKIGLRITNKDAKTRVENALKAASLDNTDSEQGFFAYLNNQYVSMVDQQGNAVDPRSMTEEQMLNTMYTKAFPEMSNAELLNLVHNNFALNALLVSELDTLDLTIDSEPYIFTEGFAKFGLKVQGGRVAYPEGKQAIRNLDTLLHNDSDGNGGILIYDLKYEDDGSRTVQTVTNLEGDEQATLRANVKAGLQEQGLYQNMITGSDRYYAIVKLPNGTYAPVNLKAEQYTISEVQDLYNNVIDRAQLTQKENTKEELLYNDQWNTELLGKLFISNKPGYFINIEVNQYGRPQINLSKRQGDKSYNLITRVELSKDVVNDTNLSSQQKMQTLIDLFNNDQDVRGEAVKVGVGNFRQSFADGASVDDIVSNTGTAVLINVIEKQKLQITADDASIQASQDVAFINPAAPTNITKPTDIPIAEEVGDDSIIGLSDEEFDIQLEEEFVNLEKEFKDQLVNKLVRGIELNERETTVYKYLESSINMMVATAGGVNSKQAEEVVVDSPLMLAEKELKIYREELLEGVPIKDQPKALRQSKEYKRLNAKYKALAKSANKILSAEKTPQEIEDINTFLDWTAYTLPAFITVEDLETIGDNFQSENQRVGAFMLNMSHIANGVDINGTIYTSRLSPFKYHEAFHGVFRMLLTDEQIAQYRNIARKEVRAKLRAEGKSFKKELGIFRNSASTYAEMTEKELENEYYEEYLADEFEKFKMDPSSSKVDAEVKSFFTRLIEWIRSLFSSVAQSELQTLFENIDAGKFQSAGLVQNEFTSSLANGPVVANALLPYSSSQLIDKNSTIRTGSLFLDSDIANPLVRSMAAMYINRISKVKGAYNSAEELQNLMDDFQYLYNPANPVNESLTEQQLIELGNIQDAFDIYPEEIIKAVTSQLNIIGQISGDETYTLDEFEDSSGVRTTSQYDKDASLIGGFNSLSTFLRAFISTTNLVATEGGETMDLYGNVELTPDEPLIIPVKFQEAYNGLLKSVKNLEDTKAILEQMYAFGVDNPHAGAVVTRILNRVGISPETLLSNDPLPVNFVRKDPGFLQAVIKGFQNYRVDYLFNERDEQGNIRIYSASERDDINAQLDKWNQAYISKKKRFKNTKIENELEVLFNDLVSALKENGTITTKSLNAKSKQYSQDLENLVGIKLSPLYIRYSILKNRPTDILNVGQASLVRNNSEQEPLTIEDVNQLNLGTQRGAFIFRTGKDGMASKLKTISENNAAFDETVGASVFKNPNGDLVYAHQLPTYHLKQVQALNNTGTIDNLRLNDPYLKNNHLLNSEAFRNLSNVNKLKIIRLAGSKVGKELTSEEDLNESISGLTSTSTYGDYTAQEFALTLINNYTANFNTTSNAVDTVMGKDAQGNNKEVAIAPVLIRVMEASNTGDLMGLPVIKSVEMNNGAVRITDEAVNIIYNEISNEFDRINREAINMGNEDNVIIQGYNNEGGRAFSFFQNKLSLSEKLRTRLEDFAVGEGAAGNEVNLKSALSFIDSNDGSLKADIRASVEIQFDIFQDTLDELNIRDQISKYIKSGLTIGQGVSRKQTLKSAELLNLNYDEEHNLKQIFINDYINTTSINQVLLGDEAMSLKDSVDQIKRAKMQNAAYYSAYSSFSAPELGVMHNVENIDLITFREPKGESSISGESIDVADAQMYITTKAFRYMWFGFGKLTQAQADLITAIETGETLPEGTYNLANEIFGNEQAPVGLVDQQAMLNSKKLVYGDGKTFLKMSAFVLTPDYTSNWNKTTQRWEAKDNKRQLHNLRVKLEAIETGQKTLAIAAPETASKMMKQQINNIEQLSTTQPFAEGSVRLDARMMGLQVLNPSNKLDIIDPTQIKELLTNEQDNSVYVKALDMTVGDIRREYNKAISERVELKFKNKRNLIFDLNTALEQLSVSEIEGNITPNLQAFLNYATQGLKASQSSENLLDFFSSQNGVQNYDLNNPITIKKFEQLFLSYFSKGTLSERAPGVSLTLVSDFGSQVYRRVYEVDADGVPVRSEIIREKVYENNPEDLVDLSVLSAGEYDGVVVLDRLRMGLMEYSDPKNPDTATGQRYTEMLMPAHHKETMELVENGTLSMPEAISKMFGVRIPTQDNHSAIAMKLVDFMPAYYGSTAMFAQELVEVSGADFDIDKVFALIKEFYVKDGRFVEYSQAGSYDEYFRYVNDRVVKSGSVYAEAASLWVEEQSESKTPITLAEENNVTDGGLSERGLQALKVLGLPITKAQYKLYVAKQGVPYDAPLNNKLVDYKYALVSNTGVTESKTGTPISYQPASTTALTDVLEELARDSEYFKNKLNEGNQDINNLNGKIRAFQANKGASIGAIVLPNLYLSLLSEYGIKSKFPISFNGKNYFDYGKKLLENGMRKQDVISALVTMATDNAKDRLVGKFSLNKNASAVVTNLIALGVPLKTAILLINNPTVQELYTESINKSDQYDAGIIKLVKDRIDKKENDKFSGISDAVLLESIDKKVTAQQTKDILNVFLQALEINKFTGNMGSITGLTKGLGKNIAEVNERAENIEKLFAEDALMDLTPIYKGNTYQNTYLRIFYQIKNRLLPSAFLTASEGFTDIVTPVLNSMDTSNNSFTNEVAEDVRVDLLSYLTIKSYNWHMMNNNSQKVAHLSNQILYPSAGGQSIVNIMEELKAWTDVNDPNNFFVTNFVDVQAADNIDNSSGLNLALSNTFRNISADQKVDLVNDFTKLYSNASTKEYAQAIIDYIMVKDGLKLGYGSLLEAIAPQVLSQYLNQIDTVRKALTGESTFESVFGVDKETISKEFSEGYLESNINGAKLVTYTRAIETGTLPKNVSEKAGNVEIKVNNASEVKEYVRIATELENGVLYKTYKRDGLPIEIGKQTVFYTEIETKGSNQQWAGGFMFDTVEFARPTYKDNRTYVKDKNGSTTKQEAQVEEVEFAIADAKSIATEALQTEDAEILSDEKSTTVNGIDLSDTKGLLDNLLSGSEAVEEQVMAANTIEDVVLPELDPNEQIQYSMFVEEANDESSQYPYLADGYFLAISNNANKQIMIENNLFPLSSMIEEYNDNFVKKNSVSEQENQEAFLDQLKCLGIK